MLDQVADLSARVVVMTERARTFLREIYEVPDAKIDLIAHGIPDMPFVDPAFYKDQFDVEGKYVAADVRPAVAEQGHRAHAPRGAGDPQGVSQLRLHRAGRHHPNLIREQGERYRISLERLAKNLGIKQNVSFYNRFVEIDELLEFIGMADIYITPYLNPAQITSGTLAYAFGCGKAVISTPYWHAEELLAEGRGVLVPFGDSAALAREICELFRDETRRHAMRKKAYMHGAGDDLEPRGPPLHGLVPAGAAEPAGHALQAAGGSDPGRRADGPAGLAAGPPGPDDRLGGDASARQLHASPTSPRAIAPTTMPGPCS